MIVMIIIHIEQKKAVVTSAVLFLFFVVLSILGILSLYTYVSHAAEVLFLHVMYLFTVSHMFLTCIVCVVLSLHCGCCKFNIHLMVGHIH